MSATFYQTLIISLLFFSITVVLASAFVPNAALSDVDQQWMKFKKTFNRTYNRIEDQYRREVWKKNVDQINRHNEEFVNGKHSYWLRVNQFTDMTWYEFKKTMLGLQEPIQDNITYSDVPRFPEVFLPDQVDWTKQGYVTAVKDQGKCGSCWAFATTGVMEGQLKKTTGKLTSLSEQNLIDCSAKYDNHGCNGGLPLNSMKYIQANGGMDTESCYPYEGKKGACRYKTSCSTAKIKGYQLVSGRSETDLKSTVATIGPISVTIHVTDTFMEYGGGVYDDTSCGSKCILDHAVLIVGYGTLDGKDYWKVKNSWGTSWGMQGYILMSRNKNNQCGIACRPTYPTM